jgi:UDP-GlcNAc:undecaprenyl-phosphate GlcNAc-1-phosphate transferase
MFEFYALIFAASFSLTAVALTVLYRLAPRLGLVDVPVGRKQHRGPTPIIGGLAICVGAAIAVGIGSIAAVPLLREVLESHIGFILGAAILAGVGLWDDHKPVPARYKLVAQLAACILAVAVDKAIVGDVGFRIGGFSAFLGSFAAPFTVLVMLTITNAINMIDGADGLAGGIVLAALLVMAKATLTAGYNSAALVVGLIGALVAFLMINAPLRPGKPALVFMGDCGSLVLGFTLAYLSIELSSLPNRVFKPSTALWFFFIPVADAIWLYLRRTWVARAPFAPGRDHIHHLLMERIGMAPTIWGLTGASAALAALAYLLERLGVLNFVLVGAWIAAFFLYGIVTHQAWKKAWAKSRKQELTQPPAANAR